jgi:hypothetical protein
MAVGESDAKGNESVCIRVLVDQRDSEAVVGMGEGHSEFREGCSKSNNKMRRGPEDVARTTARRSRTTKRT